MWPAGSHLLRYGVALGVAAVALGFTLALQSIVARIPMAFFFGAVAISAWHGGLGPGLLTAVLGVLAVEYVFIDPAYAFGPISPSDLLALSILGAVAALIATLQARLRSASRRIAAATAESAIAERARARLAAIVGSSNDAIIGKTLDGTITDWNAAAERMYGYTARETIGRPIALLVPPDRLDELAEIMERLRRGGRIDQHDTVRVTKDGRRLDVSVSISPIINERGEILGAATIARDVTERRRDEVRLRFLAEVGELLTASLDYETTLQTVTRLVVPTLADWSAIDMVQEDGSVARLAVAHQDPAKVELAHELYERYPPDPDDPTGLPHVLRSGEPELYPEIPDELLVAGSRDAEQLGIARELGLTSALIVPLVGHGRILGAMSWVYAESNRRYDESDLAFAQEVARRAALAVDNARLYRETQTAIRDRDEVLTMVSHDLRSPLTSILGQAQLLQRIVDAEEQPRLARGLERIEATTRRMDGLIDELVDVARLRVGAEIQLRRSAVDLAALVRQAVDEHEQRSGQHRITLAGGADGLVGMWDGPRLRRVLDNLLGNATKYSPEGGLIEVALRREEGADGACAVLTVRDFGVGIPPEDQQHIFEPGRRGRNVGDIGGTGIGLAGACQIVRQHGGSIGVQSELGKGSTFTVSLPLVHDEDFVASVQ